MSNWSYCNAIVLVSTYKELPDFEKIIEDMVEQKSCSTVDIGARSKGADGYNYVYQYSG